MGEGQAWHQGPFLWPFPRYSTQGTWGRRSVFFLRKLVSWGTEGEKSASSFIPWASIWVSPLSQGIQGKMGRREEKLPLFSFCLSLVAERWNCTELSTEVWPCPRKHPQAEEWRWLCPQRSQSCLMEEKTPRRPSQMEEHLSHASHSEETFLLFHYPSSFSWA